MAKVDHEMVNELLFLRWFYQNTDFGPADGDVKDIMREQYRKAGGVVPAEYDRVED